MYALRLAEDADADAFREAARRALAHNIKPADVSFVPHTGGFLFDDVPDADSATAPMTAPREFVELMRDAICHRATDRFALLYNILWRLKHGEPDLLSRASDPAVARLALYVKAVRRDIHKMHAFVRFHRQVTEDGEAYLAWFEPDHFILKRATPFFADRFANMRWIIATPIGTASWDGANLEHGPPRPKPKLEDGVLEGLWRTYYRTIFNPARIKTAMMTREMPKRYWKNMPETAQIPDLLEGAQRRLADMDRDADVAPRYAEAEGARPQMPKIEKPAAALAALAALKADAAHCTACPLYKHATQTVFGEGPASARIVFVGEQPGDQEDLAGRPFVGPAGQVFNKALADAGIDRAQVYVTNAVKHFKFEPRGKRRIHSKPSAQEVKICHPWVKQELAAVDPEIVVALGATAALSLTGKSASISSMRSRELALPDGRRGLVTVHPSYLLRLPDEASQEAEYAKFVHDLKLAHSLSQRQQSAA